MWDVLGVEPGAGRDEIRRAYARQLKQTNPEDDPEGFQALRAAYETALAVASGRIRIVPAHGEADTPEPAEAEEAVVEAEAAAPASDPSAPEVPPRRDRSARREPSEAEAAAWAAEREHRALCDRLQALVADPKAAPGALSDALDAVLRSPAADSLSVHARTEIWLANLILSNFPASDPLIDRAIEHFGWAENRRLDRRLQISDSVMARREDLRALEILRSSGNQHNPAYRALSHAPTRWRQLAWRLNPAIAGQVRVLLNILRENRPGLIPNLNPEALAWWDHHLSRPRVGPISIWVSVVSSLIVAGVLNGDAAFGEPTALKFWGATAAAFCGLVGLVLLRLYALDWPKTLWRRNWAADAPLWKRFGWAPAAPALVFAAAAIPPSVPGAIGLGVLASAAALWALITGDPDQRPRVPGNWGRLVVVHPYIMIIYYGALVIFRSGRSYPWQVRSVFAFAYLGVFWAFAQTEIPAGVWLQMSAPLALAAVAFAGAEQSLFDAWIGETGEKTRKTALIGLAAAAALAGAMVWFAGANAWMKPVAAAALAAVVLAHKTPAFGLAVTPANIREVLMKLGWIALVPAVIAFGGEQGALFRIAGLWLMIGVGVTVFAGLRGDFRRSFAPA